MFAQQQDVHQQQFHQQSQSIQHIQAEDTILKGIGFLSSPSSPQDSVSRLRKRPSEEVDENGIPTKKITILDSIPPAPPVPVANSKLQEKNKMLASLLAKQPSTPATIPHLPSSVISATPQDRLPKLLTSVSPSVRPSTGKCHGVGITRRYLITNSLWFLQFGLVAMCNSSR